MRNINPWTHIGPLTHVSLGFPKKRRLRPQNSFGSSGPEKLLKIVSCAETEKLKEPMEGGSNGLVQDVVDLLAGVLDAFNKFGFLRQYMCRLCLCNRMRYGNIRRCYAGGQIDGVLVLTVYRNLCG